MRQKSHTASRAALVNQYFCGMVHWPALLLPELRLITEFTDDDHVKDS
jgi:hypothetical protein